LAVAGRLALYKTSSPFFLVPHSFFPL
jgi:hypothetical protein